MRVLILTHPRTGGFSLLSWIARELDHHSYHEPFLSPDHAQTYPDVGYRPDVVVKEDITHLLDLGIDLFRFIQSFDRAIFHIRTDLDDLAISWARQLASGESHLVYEMNEQWISDHAKEIAQAKARGARLQEIILAQKRLCPIPFMATSYEGVYVTRQDVPKIRQFLGISDPQWLDAINPVRRLRNGDASLKKVTKKIRII
jgi:hypothetical protein